jgi:hypothetical protein
MSHRKCLAVLAIAAALPVAAQDNPLARRGAASLISLDGYWNGANLENRSNCMTAGVNGIHGTYAQYLFSVSPSATGGGTLHIHETTESNLTCDYDGGYTDDRFMPSWSGTLVCSDAKQATFQSNGFLITPTEMQVRLQMKFTSSERCDVDSILGGSRFY